MSAACLYFAALNDADVISSCVSSARISTYQEVQFHGPIEFEFARDIEAIVVHRRHQGNETRRNVRQQQRMQR